MPVTQEVAGSSPVTPVTYFLSKTPLNQIIAGVKWLYVSSFPIKHLVIHRHSIDSFRHPF